MMKRTLIQYFIFDMTPQKYYKMFTVIRPKN